MVVGGVWETGGLEGVEIEAGRGVVAGEAAAEERVEGGAERSGIVAPGPEPAGGVEAAVVGVGEGEERRRAGGWRRRELGERGRVSGDGRGLSCG